MVQNPKYWRAKECVRLQNKTQSTRKVWYFFVYISQCSLVTFFLLSNILDLYYVTSSCKGSTKCLSLRGNWVQDTEFVPFNKQLFTLIQKGGRNWKTVHVDNPVKIKRSMFFLKFSAITSIPCCMDMLAFESISELHLSSLKAVELKPLQCKF